ncbi:MAG TPA: benzoate-CoA ligase family protein [Thermoanaerobaculia bacterium]|nr:benzoate-CoA ligase family protein [Thermoanaerobaculia bacterium]
MFHPPERFNIADYFLDARVREGRGDRVALRLDGGDLTYGQVLALANRYGQVLRRLGVQPEERVMLALRDGPDFVGALFGSFKIGAVAVMANPGLPAEQLAGLLDYTRARLLVTDAATLAVAEQAVAEQGSWLRQVLVADGDGDGRPSFSLQAAGVAAELDTLPTHRDDAALWLFSGGTTGRPKAVVQSHRSYANTTELYAKAALGYHQDDVTLSVPRLFFGYATGANLFFPFAVGASAVLFPEHPTPEVLFDRIRRHRPTILVNVPTMVGKMVSHPAAAAQDLSCLRLATSAGEALPAPLYERWMEVFGVELLDGLGTAEMWHVFLSNLPGAVRPGTLGRAVPGFDVRVCDDEGREVPRGELGRLWVRGGSRATAYWRNLEMTAETFRGEWVALGDLVRMDDEGWVSYQGRADDVLKVGGKWCAPQEVESCLLAHPAVRECAVVGVEDADGLTKPWAFVVAAEGGAGAELEAELKELALDRLEAHKHPRRVVVLATLPRTHLGKVDRGRLKREAAALR